MNVALVQCPVWGTREPPLALVQLSGCLKAAGHAVRSFDLNNHLYRNRKENIRVLWAWEQSFFWYRRDEVQQFFQDIRPVLDAYADTVLGCSPSLVGFSVAASSCWSSVFFAQLLKEKMPDLRIVFGGQMFACDPDAAARVLRESSVDYVITGEADVTLPELATVLEEHRSIGDCPGVHYGEGDAVRYTGDRPMLSDLNDLPYMDFTDLKIEDYDDTVHISLMSSRGCVWQCAFCSSRAFWNGYRYMSGKRIHQEITHHRTNRFSLGHVDFADLVFNGNPARVIEFCALMVKYPPFPSNIRWVANAIVSPSLTREVLALMHEGGCKKLTFGIESGSQRVLELMQKRYRIEDAKRVIRDASEAGIEVTANFMFGFPGETEKDFEETLDFLRSVGPYLERAYPSRTYCAMEESSYLYRHPAEFNVKTPFSHHLYWETNDGSNTYPVRLKRCQRFEKLCSDLGVRVDCGVQTDVEMDEWFNLGCYYEFVRDYPRAVDYLIRYLQRDPVNEVVRQKLQSISAASGERLSRQARADLDAVLQGKGNDGRK